MIKTTKHNVFIFVVLGLLFLVNGIMYYFISANYAKEERFFRHNDSLNQLQTKNSNFDNFIEKRLELIIFDDINEEVDSFETMLNLLIDDANTQDLSIEYKTSLITIKKEFQKKILWMERLKSRKAFEFNAISFLMDNQSDEFLKLPATKQAVLNSLRVKLLKSTYYKYSDVEKLFESYGLKESGYDYVSNLIRQAKALEKNIAMQKNNLPDTKNIKLKIAIQNSKNILQEDIDLNKLFHWVILNGLFLSIFGFVFILIFLYKRLDLAKLELLAFKTAVENSDNVVVITDSDRKIIFVNEAFTKVTGYAKEEALGKKPNILKSGVQSKEFYAQMNETIDSGKKWHGQFINKNSAGELFYENATITPIFTHNELSGYLAIKLDVTESVKHAEELEKLNETLENRVKEQLEKARAKDKLLMQQAKLASMGEMIGNIAHQWRQPLSAISTCASGLKLHDELGILNSEDLHSYTDSIVKNSQYLSNTIDNFRNFFTPDKPKEVKHIVDVFEMIDSIFGNSMSLVNIEIIKNIQDFTMDTHINELRQVLINLIKNAKDAIDKDGYIFIDCFIDDKIYIKVKDSGGGIPENVIDKIYEPYFTTKHQSIGTGIGLNMSYQIVTEHLKGNIEVKNVSFEYDNKILRGAEFTVSLSKDLLV